MVMLSILHKFAIHYSFARWLLAHRSVSSSSSNSWSCFMVCTLIIHDSIIKISSSIIIRLIRYLQPTEQQIKRGVAALANERKAHHEDKNAKQSKLKTNKQSSFRGKRGRSDKSKTDENLVPKKLALTLEAERVNPLDLMQLNFYKEYHWLIDFALYATIVYIASEIQFYLIPESKEMNLSLIWCILVICFTT